MRFHTLEHREEAKAFIANAKNTNNHNAVASYRRGVLDASGGLPTWLTPGKPGRPRKLASVHPKP
jgi:hypothetical protein